MHRITVTGVSVDVSIEEVTKLLADCLEIMSDHRQSQQPKQQELHFPKLVALVLSENIKLFLDGCKVHKTLAGKLCLVHPVYGTMNGYYGSFEGDRFVPNKYCTKEMINQLQDIEENGIEAAKRIGLLTGNCCVCGRTLTNEDSIAGGIGPICGGKFASYGSDSGL